MVFEKKFEAGWSSIDANGHMANTGYLDYAVDTRMSYFAIQGFPSRAFQQMQFGPVIKSDTVEYFREIRLMEPFKVTLEVSGLALNASKFRIVNKFYRDDGKQAALITTVGGWLSFTDRRLIVPPDGIRTALHNLAPTEDFEVFDPSVV